MAITTDYRASLGLPADPESDAIWERRIAAGTATESDAEQAIGRKYLQRLGEQRSSNPFTGDTGAGGGSTGGGGGGSGTGGGGAAPVEEVITLNYRELAGNMFPWLTSGLLSQFADKWAETGNPQFALDATRQSAEYGRVFPGIRRDDGSLRMNENEYFSQQAGFREALAEFGHNPADFEDRFTDLFEGEVGAQELAQAASQAQQRFTEPGQGRTGLADDFLGAFFATGSQQVALEQVRDSDAYRQVFAGNRRDDGTVRMDEPEYFAYKRGWQRSLAGFGLNPEEFASRGLFVGSVEGEQSIQELQQRLQTAQDGILDKVDEVRAFYAEGYGIDATPEAILGAFIDPSVQRDLLERRITASQIGGEASAQGFMRGVERAEGLARAGLTQQDARNLYSSAAETLSGLSAATRRANIGRVTLGNFEDATALSDAEQRLRINRGLRSDASRLSDRSTVRRDQEGSLIALRQQ